MKRLLMVAAAAAFAACLFATMPSPPAHAGTSLKKIGNAIQYPIRKTGENISISTHRAVGNNSVQHTNHGHNVVITPGGNKYMIHHRYAHRMYSNRRYYWHNGHRYYQNTTTGRRYRAD